jgi:hypothetical protein
MRRFIAAAVLVGVAITPALANAQTPGAGTATPPQPSQTPGHTAAPTQPTTTPEAIPPASPTQYVFYGEVRAPVGTTVTANYLGAVSPKNIVCATTTTTPGADPSRSRFVLIVEQLCVEQTADGPVICWGEGLCHYPFLGSPQAHPFPVPGDTIDLGLLPLPQEGEATATMVPAQGSVGPDLVLPEAGELEPIQDRTRVGWLLWAGLGLVLAGLGAGAVTISKRRAQK